MDRPEESDVTPAQLYAAILADFPDHAPRTRPVHAVGVAAAGNFVPSAAATTFTAAEHFAGPAVPVTARFANGSGSPTVRDGARDVRGLSVKFHLHGEAETDLLMVTLPLFFAATPGEFLAFAEAGVPAPRQTPGALERARETLMLRQPLPAPDPDTPDGLAGVVTYADGEPSARPGVVAMMSVVTPTSYARVAYHALHAFKLTDAAGTVRYGRFSWEPVAGVRPHPDPHPPDDYLRAELVERLARGPVRFVLRMSLAEQGDPLDDPTRWWDTTRQRVVMGELVLTDLVADQESAERLSFNPTRLVAGFEGSDDPVLAARGPAYEYSCRQRGGHGCPVMGTIR